MFIQFIYFFLQKVWIFKNRVYLLVHRKQQMQPFENKFTWENEANISATIKQMKNKNTCSKNGYDITI